MNIDNSMNKQSEEVRDLPRKTGDLKSQPTAQGTKSLGQYRVGIDFNPGNYSVVGEIKQRAAELIDHTNEMAKFLDKEYSTRVNGSNVMETEQYRLFKLAMEKLDKITTDIEEVAMWAVKAVTKPNR